MNKGLIPKKKIVPMPITHEEALSGGAARCMTLPVPSALESCTQTQVDRKLRELISKTGQMTSCLESSPDATICIAARDLSIIVDVLARTPEVTLEYSMDAQGGEGKIEFDKGLVNKLVDEANKLAAAIAKFCRNL